MKLIISENQYKRLLEVKHSTLLNEYENVDLGDGYQNLVPEFGNLLTHLSTLSLQNNTVTSVKVNSGKEIVVDTNNEELLKSLKDYIEGSRIDWETSEDNGKLTIKYTKKILPVVSSDDDDGGVESEIDDATYDVDNIIGNVINNVPNNTSVEDLDSVVRNLIKKENPTFYEEVKDKDYFIRYCFPHFHKGIDVGGHSELGEKIVFKKPFKVIDIGKTCFVLKEIGGEFHRFCHCQKVNDYIKKDKTYPKGIAIGEVGNVGFGNTSTAPHVHYEIGSGNSGNKLTGHKDPKNDWKVYWGVMKDDFYYDENNEKKWKRKPLERSGTGFGRREPINSLCNNFK